jgi:hypothetical protein
MEFGTEFIRPASHFINLLFYITLTINIIIVVSFSKMNYLKAESGFVKGVGYTGSLLVS